MRKQMLWCLLVALMPLAGCRQPTAAIAFSPAATVTKQAGPDPTMTNTVNVNVLKAGESAIYTSVLAVPTTETKTSVAVVWTCAFDPVLLITEVIGPGWDTSTVTIIWRDAPAPTGTAYSLGPLQFTGPGGKAVRFEGVKLPLTSVFPNAENQLQIMVGDMAVGQTITITVKVTRKSTTPG